jgi:hypothetical protein
MNVKNLVRCGNINPCKLIVDMGELHTDPVWFESQEKEKQ